LAGKIMGTVFLNAERWILLIFCPERKLLMQFPTFRCFRNC
jgi:hypothetical protein